MIDASLFAPAPHTIHSQHRVDHGVRPGTVVKPIPQPAWATTKKLARAQTMGARYESRIAKHLQTLADKIGWELQVGPWLSYDNSVAQPDFLLISPSRVVIVFEVKLTWVDTTNQLALYKALLANMDYHPIVGCTICRNVTPETPSVIHEFTYLEDASVWQVRV